MSIGSAVGFVVRGHFVLEEHPENRDRRGDNGCSCLDDSPNSEVFPLVVEVLFAELHEIDAFDDGTYTSTDERSVFSCTQRGMCR